MKRIYQIPRAGIALMACLVAMSCSEMGNFSTGDTRGFQIDYHSARSALESGSYSTAIRRYNALLPTSGPLESRLRLELSHALLRADKYPEAASEATQVATAHNDNRRTAALTVLGTAEHRQAQEAMSRGDFGPTTVGHLKRAEAAFAEVLKANSEFDPLGTMSERQAMVQASLKNIGA